MSGPVIKVKIDVSKIDKKYLFKGKKGVYLDAVLWRNDSEYGDFSIQQQIPKEARDKGEQAPYIGNADKAMGWPYDKNPEVSNGNGAQKLPEVGDIDDGDDVPF
jgi:hypothetical protein